MEHIYQKNLYSETYYFPEFDKFIDNFKSVCYNFFLSCYKNTNFEQIINKTIKCISSVTKAESDIHTYPDNLMVITDKASYFIMLRYNDNDEPLKIKKRRFSFEFFGDIKVITKIYKKLEKEFKTDRANLSWYYMTGDGKTQNVYVDISKDIKVHNSYYPFINKDIQLFFKEYNESDSNILLFVGEPGTGKTSLIKYYINKFNKQVMVTHDAELMEKDDLYMNFITSHNDVLVIEDADNLLFSRQDTENKVISKILNVSDGLIKSSGKKIIFTANITNLGRIDTAVMRPGRCFSLVHFRPLTKDEAIAAGKDAGIEYTGKDGCTLSELFNKKNMAVTTAGFSI